MIYYTPTTRLLHPNDKLFNLNFSFNQRKLKTLTLFLTYSLLQPLLVFYYYYKEKRVLRGV